MMTPLEAFITSGVTLRRMTLEGPMELRDAVWSQALEEGWTVTHSDFGLDVRGRPCPWRFRLVAEKEE